MYVPGSRDIYLRRARAKVDELRSQPAEARRVQARGGDAGTELGEEPGRVTGDVSEQAELLANEGQGGAGPEKLPLEERKGRRKEDVPPRKAAGTSHEETTIEGTATEGTETEEEPEMKATEDPVRPAKQTETTQEERNAAKDGTKDPASEKAKGPSSEPTPSDTPCPPEAAAVSAAEERGTEANVEESESQSERQSTPEQELKAKLLARKQELERKQALLKKKQVASKRKAEAEADTEGALDEGNQDDFLKTAKARLLARKAAKKAKSADGGSGYSLRKRK